MHGLDIRGQLRVFDIEQHTNVPAKFQFPMYEHLQWYAAAYYLKVGGGGGGGAAAAGMLQPNQGYDDLLSCVQKLRHPRAKEALGFIKALIAKRSAAVAAASSAEGTKEPSAVKVEPDMRAGAEALVAVGLTRQEIAGAPALLRLLVRLQARAAAQAMKGRRVIARTVRVHVCVCVCVGVGVCVCVWNLRTQRA